MLLFPEIQINRTHLARPVAANIRAKNSCEEQHIWWFSQVIVSRTLYHLIFIAKRYPECFQLLLVLFFFFFSVRSQIREVKWLPLWPSSSMAGRAQAGFVKIVTPNFFPERCWNVVDPYIYLNFIFCVCDYKSHTHWLKWKIRKSWKENKIHPDTIWAHFLLYIFARMSSEGICELIYFKCAEARPALH